MAGDIRGQEFAPQAWVFREGDDAESAFVVMDGTVRIFKSRNGLPHRVFRQTERGDSVTQEAPRLRGGFEDRDPMPLLTKLVGGREAGRAGPDNGHFQSRIRGGRGDVL